MKMIDDAVENSFFAGKYDVPVIKWDVVDVGAGAIISVRFISKKSEYRQGIRMQTDGVIVVNGDQFPSIELWEDTAPERFDIRVESLDGKLHIYNHCCPTVS
ncbi:hypothetical protein A9Q81_09810 [Gammaproteobacteria bacterium 42_54_T18]|nr:hypothetical protein A9Q81_09810 [Gammaproteobacteria bacterium 42_54_T18]